MSKAKLPIYFARTLSEVALAFAVFIQDCNSIHFFSEAKLFSCVSEAEFTAEYVRAASVRHSC